MPSSHVHDLTRRLRILTSPLARRAGAIDSNGAAPILPQRLETPPHPPPVDRLRPLSLPKRRWRGGCGGAPPPMAIRSAAVWMSEPSAELPRAPEVRSSRHDTETNLQDASAGTHSSLPPLALSPFATAHEYRCPLGTQAVPFQPRQLGSRAAEKPRAGEGGGEEEEAAAAAAGRHHRRPCDVGLERGTRAHEAHSALAARRPPP